MFIMNVRPFVTSKHWNIIRLEYKYDKFAGLYNRLGKKKFNIFFGDGSDISRKAQIEQFQIYSRWHGGIL